MAKNLNLEEDDNTVHEGNDVRRWHFSAAPTAPSNVGFRGSYQPIDRRNLRTANALAAVGTLGVALAPLRIADQWPPQGNVG